MSTSGDPYLTSRRIIRLNCSSTGGNGLMLYVRQKCSLAFGLTSAPVALLTALGGGATLGEDAPLLELYEAVPAAIPEFTPAPISLHGLIPVWDAITSVETATAAYCVYIGTRPGPKRISHSSGLTKTASQSPPTTKNTPPKYTSPPLPSPRRAGLMSNSSTCTIPRSPQCSTMPSKWFMHWKDKPERAAR